MVTDQEVIDYFVNIEKQKIIASRSNRKALENTAEFKAYLDNRFEDFRGNYCEVIARIYWHIEEIPRCETCGKKLNFIGFKHPYNKTCSTKCHINSKSFKDKTLKTLKEKYNVDNISKSKETVDKIRKTKLLRYGSETYTNHEKFEETCMKKYNGKSPLVDKEIREKGKETKLKKYGNENYTNREKFKETCLEKFGVKNPMQVKEICMKTQSKEITLKRNNTKRKNNTFNSSKPEEEIFERLKETFGEENVLRQFTSKEYPFNCDFYIKDLALYIELNFHWTHGLHRFNPLNEEDLKKLELWTSKGTKFYKKAIETWTKRDVKKFKIAEEKCLNYLVFYNEKEFSEWLKIVKAY